jgi:quinol monooxygenase YgiN
MVTVGLYVRLQAKPGKEEEVARFLREALPLVEAEPATQAWFAVRFDSSTFGIFDAFPDEAGRQAHLSGAVAAALMAQASELFAHPPKIEKLDLMASKLPPHKAGRAGREEQIPMQVGSELRITNSGEIIVDNPELELARYMSAADAVLGYRFNPDRGEHVLRLIEPLADHKHMQAHRRDD